MREYIARRMLLFAPTLLLISAIVFSLIRLLPGDVVTLMVEDYSYAANLDEMRHRLGLDRPIYEQYLSWVGNLLRGDFGESLWTRERAADELRRRLPVSVELGLLAITISTILGVSVGVFSAIRQDTISDYIARTITIAFLAIPGFWIATLVIVFPSIWWRWTPPLEFVPFTQDPLRNLSQFILPALIMGTNMSATVMRMTRAMMLEVLRQDYIRTAWAKGLRERVVIYRHALKNAMIPVITVIGIQVPIVIGGVVIMETVFSLPGLGRFMVDVVNKRDYPILQFLNLFFASAILVVNLLVDLAYGYLDPRIRYH